MTLLSLKAFFHALPYAHENFKVENERNFIMGKLFEGFKVEDEDCQITALQTLVEIGKLEYDHIHNYFPMICEVTGKLAKSAEDRVGAQAIEFWTSLAEEEVRRKENNEDCKGYILHSAGDLLPLLLDCIKVIKIEEDEEMEDELGVALSSGCCLASISLLLKDLMLDPILKFVSDNLPNPDWRLRYSALLALGAIVEGPEKVKFMGVISPALETLIN